MTYARTLITDFCPISRCDGVIKSLFNRTTPAMYVCIHARPHEAPDNESNGEKRHPHLAAKLVRRPGSRSRLSLFFLADASRRTVRPSVCPSASETRRATPIHYPSYARGRQRERERRDLQSDVNDDHLPPFLNSK